VYGVLCLVLGFVHAHSVLKMSVKTPEKHPSNDNLPLPPPPPPPQPPPLALFTAIALNKPPPPQTDVRAMHAFLCTQDALREGTREEGTRQACDTDAEVAAVAAYLRSRNIDV
jgi:hypothetical protein